MFIDTSAVVSIIMGEPDSVSTTPSRPRNSGPHRRWFGWRSAWFSRPGSTSRRVSRKNRSTHFLTKLA